MAMEIRQDGAGGRGPEGGNGGCSAGVGVRARGVGRGRVALGVAVCGDIAAVMARHDMVDRDGPGLAAHLADSVMDGLHKGLRDPLKVMEAVCGSQSWG